MDTKLRNISTIDEDICRESSSRASPMTSVSFRNKEEFEFIKMLYRDFDRAGRAFPLLFGLTYINNDFRWSDDAPFNYDGFLDVAYEARLSNLKEDDCRRFFLYSPASYSDRNFYTFDIKCNSQFYEYFISCRYQLPKIYEEALPRIRTHGKTAEKEHVQDYDYNYGNIFSNCNSISSFHDDNFFLENLHDFLHQNGKVNFISKIDVIRSFD